MDYCTVILLLASVICFVIGMILVFPPLAKWWNDDGCDTKTPPPCIGGSKMVYTIKLERPALQPHPGRDKMFSPTDSPSVALRSLADYMESCGAIDGDWFIRLTAVGSTKEEVVE